MQDYFYQLLTEFGLTFARILSLFIVLTMMGIITLILYTLFHRSLLPRFKRFLERKPHTWQQLATENKLLDRLTLLALGVLIHLQAILWLHDNGPAQQVITACAQIWILLFILLSIFSVADITLIFFRRSTTTSQLPLRGIFQSMKLIATLVISVMIISLLLGKSPLLLISGLGAMTAVLMLIFKDPIMGLVAGIQLSTNDMVRLNDWLEMPKYGADGSVIDIGLTTVKVQNWDNTVTTIPTYALIADSFKNWRAMSESGGRRIKRCINIDTTSIHFLTAQEITALTAAQLLTPYIEDKQQEIDHYNDQHLADLNSPLNGRRLTNVGTFRAYLFAYLTAHPKIHQQMSLMVRQLSPTSEGLPIEIYAFTNTTVWRDYEDIQADIFDHIFAIIGHFNLRIYQSPTGNDIRAIEITSSTT